MTSEQIAARRADIDAKQHQVAEVLEELGCEAALLLLPTHVAWFTCGLTARGLVADNERPGIFTNGRQRWLVCSNVDSQRFFDESLDHLGFQLKEWTWSAGRADLLHNLCTGRKMASDRPFSGVVLANEKLRPLMRTLSPYERADLAELGRITVHAVEATARGLRPGDTEEEAAGQLGHRLLHHGVEPVALDVKADDRGRKYRRAGFTAAAATTLCFLQATAQRNGQYVTVGRTVAFGPPQERLRTEYDHAARLAALHHSLSIPGETVTGAVAAQTKLLAGTEYEFEALRNPLVYGCGRVPADELRRGGHDEPFVGEQALVWQTRVGAAAVVDTVIVSYRGAVVRTPSEEWPIKRIRIGAHPHIIPDLLVREASNRAV